MFNSLKSTLKKGISVAAQVADTGIFEGVPIVSNVLCACTYINEQIEASDAQDEKLQEVRDLLDSVSPIVGKLGASVNQFSNDQAMKSNLKAMSGTMEELWGKVDEYMRSHAVVQQIKARASTEDLDSLLDVLRKQLDQLSFALTGETYLAVLRVESTMSRAAESMAEAKDELGTVHSEVDHIEHEVENIEHTLQSMEKKKNAQELRMERHETMEIDDRMITWHESEPFAHGSFGAVYRVTYEREVVVAKTISLREVPKAHLEATKKEYMKEVALMSNLRSQNIVSILGCTTRPLELVILMEYCDKGSLRHLLDQPPSSSPLTFADQVNMGLDIAYGMTYLHTHRVIHQDLKSLNVLIDFRGKGKVADFGRSKSDSMSSTTDQKESGVGTYAWCAPEVIDGEPATQRSDVYSFGVVLWEMATRGVPWSGMTPIQIIKKMMTGERPAVPVDMHPDYKRLVEMCWDTDPKKRPYFDQIIKSMESLSGGPQISKAKSFVMPDINVTTTATATTVFSSQSVLHPEAATAITTPVALPPANTKPPAKDSPRKANLKTGADALELLSQILEEGGSECDTKSVALDDEFFEGFELVLLDGDDLTDAMKKAFVDSITKTGREDTFTAANWKKFYMKWRKSEQADSMVDYLDRLMWSNTELMEEKGIFTYTSNRDMSEFREKAREVIIARDVTAVHREAFRDFRDVRKVTFEGGCPELTRLEWGCFSRMPMLKEIDLPAALEFTDECIFEGCNALSRVALPDGLSDIRQKMLHSCAVKTIKMPESLTVLTRGTFWNCDKLTEVVLPKGLQRIESVAFVNCKALKSLRVPKGCEITRDAFNDSGMKLKNVTWFDPVSGVDEEPEPVDPLEEKGIFRYVEGMHLRGCDDV
ncbi:hypothetical protein TrCOL_g9093, partial [Triparma columacea]